METLDTPTSWKGLKDPEHAKRLIDYGVLLSWRDARQMRKSMELTDVAEIAIQ